MNLAILADGAVPDWVPNFIVDMTVGDIVGYTVAVIFLVSMVRKVRPFFENIKNFLDDWNGTSPRPGVDRRPGVMERLDKVEEGVAQTNHQLHPNGGNSIADKINKITGAVVTDTPQVPTQRNGEQ